DSPAGDGDRGRRRGDVGHALATARRRHRPRLRSGGPRRRRDGAHDRRPRPPATGRGRGEALHQASGEDVVAASESYPDGVLYHPEHDWARVEGDEAVLGVTWHAQDALGELVHFEPPAVGAAVERDLPYGEVESVKAVSDVVAPLSGTVIEVNAKV